MRNHRYGGRRADCKGLEHPRILVSLGVLEPIPHGCKRTTVLCKVKERLNLNRSGTRKINDEDKVPITAGAVGMKIKGYKRK